MHFLTQTNLDGDNILRIINCNSWSNCLLYLEGLQQEILQILKFPDTINIIVSDTNTSNCYNVTLKDTNTFQTLEYILFENSYSDLQNWISQQTNKEVISIFISEKTYVNV